MHKKFSTTFRDGDTVTEDNNNLQLRRAFSDMPGIKKGQYYIATKTNGQAWEPADTEEDAIANYYNNRKTK